MESQVLDLSVPSRKRANSNKSNFDDFSDSDSSRSSSPLDNERCPSQQYIRHCSSMRLPTRVKSRTDWSGQSDDGLDTSPPEVIHDDRVPDDKSIFRNYQYSPMKMSSQGYEVTESPFQRYGTLKWIQQSQENFHESIYNFEQFTYDSKMGRSPEQTDARPFMYNSALDLSSSSKKVEVSLNRGFTNSAPELRTTPLVNKSKMGLGHMPCVYQSAEKAGKIEASMKEEQASPSPPNHPSPSPDLEPTISKKVDGITVTLHDSNLWNTFRKHGTEMIINRNGRRMFPHLDLSLQGLNPTRLYNILLEVCPADGKRYKFINNKWTPVGMADPMLPNPPVLHHDSPNIGSFWMGKLSFAKIKITNHKDSNDGMIVLQSMHKYMIKVIIQPAGSDGKGLQNEIVIPLEETAFFAVTAYQNETIIQLKIHNNPFAKAFRDHRIGQPSRSRHAGKNLTEISKVKMKLNEGGDVQNKRKRYEHLDKSKKLNCVQKSPPSILSFTSVLSESPNRPHDPFIPPYLSYNGFPYMGFERMPPGFTFPSYLPSMLFPPQS